MKEWGGEYFQFDIWILLYLIFVGVSGVDVEILQNWFEMMDRRMEDFIMGMQFNELKLWLLELFMVVKRKLLLLFNCFLMFFMDNMVDKEEIFNFIFEYIEDLIKFLFLVIQ